MKLWAGKAVECLSFNWLVCGVSEEDDEGGADSGGQLMKLQKDICEFFKDPVMAVYVIFEIEHLWCLVSYD